MAFIPGSPLSPFGKTKLNLAADDVPTFVTEAVEPLETVPMVIVAAWPGSPLSPFTVVGLPSIAFNEFVDKPVHCFVYFYDICHSLYLPNFSKVKFGILSFV